MASPMRPGAAGWSRRAPRVSFRGIATLETVRQVRISARRESWAEDQAEAKEWIVWCEKQRASDSSRSLEALPKASCPARALGSRLRSGEGRPSFSSARQFCADELPQFCLRLASTRHEQSCTVTPSQQPATRHPHCSRDTNVRSSCRTPPSRPPPLRLLPITLVGPSGNLESLAAAVCEPRQAGEWFIHFAPTTAYLPCSEGAHVLVLVLHSTSIRMEPSNCVSPVDQLKIHQYCNGFASRL